MANDENTAVNDLIARVGGRPLKPAVQKSSVQMPAVGIGNETMPASPRAMAMGMGSSPSSGAHTMPLPPPVERRGLPESVAAASGVPAWSFEAQRRIDDGEHLIGTLRVTHKSNEPHPMRRYVPMVLLAFAGVLVGVVIALRTPSKAPSSTAPAVAAVVPAAAPAPAAIVTPASAAVVTPASAAVVTPAPAAVVTPAPVAVVTPAPAVVTPAPPVVTPAPVVVASAPTAAVVTPAPTAAVVTPAPPAAVVTPAPAAAVVTPAPAAATSAPAAATLAPPVVATPAPAVAVAAAPATMAKLAAGAVSTLIDVRIDSLPAGATVMLVDRGKTQLVGNTPIAAAIDPTRDYDLVLTYAGKPTKIEHLDPRITQHITVALDASAPPAPPAPPPTPRVEPAPVAAPRRQVEAPIRHEARAEAPRGEGTLMVSSKPPCEIVIDGRSTGLTTPQRAIALSAGRHKITLVNGDKDIKRTFSVQISPNATEKLIQDLMH